MKTLAEGTIDIMGLHMYTLVSIGAVIGVTRDIMAADGMGLGAGAVAVLIGGVTGAVVDIIAGAAFGDRVDIIVGAIAGAGAVGGGKT